MGMPPLANNPYRSKTVSSLVNTPGFVVGELNKFLQARGMRLANGYGKLKEKNFPYCSYG
jgi:aspartate aminotransferase-like enzyme